MTPSIYISDPADQLGLERLRVGVWFDSLPPCCVGYCILPQSLEQSQLLSFFVAWLSRKCTVIRGQLEAKRDNLLNLLEGVEDNRLCEIHINSYITHNNIIMSKSRIS